MGTKKAMVVGATGLVGRHITEELLQNPAYSSVTAIQRQPFPIKHPKLKQRVVHFDQLQQEIQKIKVDDIFCCLGTTMKKAKTKEAFRRVDLDYPLILAKHARTHARQFLIVTGLGANPHSRFFYNRVKGELEEKLKQLMLPSLHIFRPSLLLGKREEFRFGESVLAVTLPALSMVLQGKWKKYRAIQGKTVARAMIKAANQEKSGIHIYESTITQLGK